ncbi:hypothetical protein E2C01_048391 [Portunus trituberculatus]|uniref:Uncharacterized protein n=1 Tax=Portunus trituberculatus TaxID=210409 RepID=A0A5B7GB10_PORTR|nr:hypothetical protein [Portunus trituberculatus]
MVADPNTFADLFPEHFASVSRKDHRQRMESLGVNFSSTGGESYSVPFSVYELRTALSQCHDSSPENFIRYLDDCAPIVTKSPFAPWMNDDIREAKRRRNNTRIELKSDR